jgi:hypothetical protein
VSSADTTTHASLVDSSSSHATPAARTIPCANISNSSVSVLALGAGGLGWPSKTRSQASTNWSMFNARRFPPSSKTFLHHDNTIPATRRQTQQAARRHPH